MTTQTISIDIVIDLVCPWCFLGKRRLDNAIKEYQSKSITNADINFNINWLPYRLVPNAPKISVLKSVNYAERFGEQRSKQMIDHMIQTGKTDGIAFDYSGKIGNTFDAHRLIYYAHKESKQNEIVEALFHNYFELQNDIADNDILVNIAASVGLDREKVSKFINSSEGVDKVNELLSENSIQSGVPSFTVQDKYFLSGGQPSYAWLKLFDKVLN